MDGKVIHEFKTTPVPLSMSTTLDKSSSEVIIKLVNPADSPVQAEITLKGTKSVAAKAQLISMSGGRADVNSFENPEKIKPVSREIDSGPSFSHRVPAMAVEFIRVKVN